MHLIAFFTTATLLTSGAVAQYGSGYGSNYGSGDSSSAMSMSTPMSASSAMMSASTPAPSGQVSVQVVKVSNKNGTLKFTPNNIVAAPGSMVQYQFYPKNHSVVQSTFGQPCQPIVNNQPNVTGFFSGFMPVKAGAEMPVYTIMINNTAPIWFYCSQGDHCQSGMVGVINAPKNSPKNIAAFAALAAQAPCNLSPGQTSCPSTSMGGYSNSTSPPYSTGMMGGTPASSTVGGGVAGSSSTATSSAPVQVSSSGADRKQVVLGGVAGLVAAWMALAL